MRISELHKAFGTSLLARGSSASTVAAYRGDLRLLVEFLGADDIRCLTRERLMRFADWLAARGDGPRTIGRRMAAVGSFCKWLMHRGDLTANPADGVPRPKKPRRLPRSIPLTWIETLEKAELTPGERALLAVMRYAGLRVSELANLTVGDIDLAAGVLVIRQGKGDADRAIPIDPDAAAAIQSHVAGQTADAFLFRGVHGGAGRKAIGRMLAKVTRRVGVPYFTTHQVRHTFATEAAKAGTPLPVLQAILGHKSAETTRLYIDVAAQDLRDAMAQLSAWRKQQCEKRLASTSPAESSHSTPKSEKD